MTIPMPGPPGGFTDRARLNYALLGKQITYEQYQEFGDALTRAFTARPKRMTDAECAAEYWRAASDFRDRLRHGLAGDDLNPEWERRLIWHRFAALPHALEVTP